MIQQLLLLLCFFASGAAALLYQTAWTREFSTVFGTSELAIVAVLAAYMAGLAGGAAVAGRLAHRVRRPVLAYGALELGIALGALAVPFGIRAVTALYVGVFGGLETLPEGESLARTGFHVAGAFAVLMPCAGLMGATLPLLARHAVREESQIGPRVGLLYAMNTAGAIAGTVCAGFWLLPTLGLRDTVYVGVALNCLVFLAAAALARVAMPVAPTRQPESGAGPRWILLAMTLSGMVSFSYEVLWSRLLGQVIGGSIPAFSTMLASFLLGIALGSAVAARFARTARGAALGFALVQLGAAAFGWLAFAFADRLPDLARRVGASAYEPEAGALVAVAVLLPLTLCFGATFPFAVRIHARDVEDAGPASARVYAWNTVGSILGALLAGLWLLPTFGLEGTVALGVATSLVLALAASVLAGSVQRFAIAAVVAGGVGLALFPPQLPIELLMTAPLAARRHPGDPVFVGVGRSSTVVLSSLGPQWRLTTNGLPEALISSPDYPLQVPGEAEWLSIAPALARPDAERLLLIGLGGGITLGAVPSTLRHVDVVELEPRVLEANRIATPRLGGDPLDDPRVHVHVADARGALMLSPARYDAIVSQPSHPWTSGASHLYTREFFELVRDHLTPDGVFVQWMGAMFITKPLLESLLATLLDVFPHVELLRPDPTSLIFVASGEPVDLVESGARALARHPQAFAPFGITRVEHLAATRALTTESVRRFAGEAPLLTDDRNPLGSGLGRGLRAQGLDRLLAPFDALNEGGGDLDVAQLVRRMTVMAHANRLSHRLKGLDPATRAAAEGWMSRELGRSETAAMHFERSLELEPDLRAARVGLAVAGREVGEGAAPADEALLREAAHAAQREDWEALRSLDSALAALGATHLAYPEALRLRIDWRLGSPSADDRAESLRLADALLLTGWRGEDLLRRVRAAAAAGRPELAWLSLDIAADRIPSARPRLRRAAQELAESLPDSPRAERVRELLKPGGTRSAARRAEP